MLLVSISLGVTSGSLLTLTVNFSVVRRSTWLINGLDNWDGETIVILQGKTNIDF